MILAIISFNLSGADPVRLPVVGVAASADDGNIPGNTLDGLLTTRWSAQGPGQWIQFDVGTRTTLRALKIATHRGNVRTAQYEIQTSDTGTGWTTLTNVTSSGTTTDLETYDLAGSTGQFVRLVGYGNSLNDWNSIAEVEVHGTPAGLAIAAGPTAGSLVTLSWPTTIGTRCQVQASSNLLAWTDISPVITNTAPNQSWVEDVSQLAAAERQTRYYRLKQLTATEPPDDPILPSAVLNLTNWKLTLPVNTAHGGNPDEYLQPELNGFLDPDYFHLNAARDGVVFKAHCGGATTSGSGYPRSELREMTSNGSAQASWSTTSGIHTMEITQAITHLPDVKRHVVAGQIHDANDDVIVFRLEGSKLFIDENGNDGPVLTTNYQLGDVFTVKFVARNGGVECHYNGQYVYTYAINTAGCYFKAGCYTQSNVSRGDAPTAYGEVVIYDLAVTHQ